MLNNSQYDVVIIGGSYAGLSAAMALGRSMRKVLIIDNGIPCNRQTKYSHNFITHDGESPAAIAQIAREQVSKYPTVEFANNTAVAAYRIEYGFEVKAANNTVHTSKKLIFATGVLDIMPQIKGFAECWGISILHCPYCHGYEVKDLELGIIANGDTAFEICKLIRHWSKNLTLFCDGKSTLGDEQYEQLKKHRINVVEKEIAQLVHSDGQIKHIVFKDGSTQNIAAIFSKVAFKQHTDIPKMLGCAITEQGFLQIDAMQKTTVAGIYATGDCTSIMRAISFAVGMGTVAGAVANKDLIDENF